MLLAAPFIFFTIYLKRDVTWRGRSYSLDGGSRLEEGDALEAVEGVGGGVGGWGRGGEGQGGPG